MSSRGQAKASWAQSSAALVGLCLLSGGAVFAIALQRDNSPAVAAASGVTSAVLIVTVTAILRVAWSLIVGDDLIGRAQVRVNASTAALRQEKARVLRALKELDFDHELRKISGADFAEIRDHYRLRAIELSRMIDGANDLHPRTLDVLAQRQRARSVRDEQADAGEVRGGEA